MPNILFQLQRLIHRTENGLLVATFLLLISFSLTQIILRNVFDGGLLWLDGASRVLVLWLALIGASVAGREGRHIRIQLLDYLAPALQQLAFRVTNLCCGIISGIIAWHSALFVWDERSYGDTAFANVPLWLCEVIIPVTFALLALRFIISAFVQSYQNPYELDEKPDADEVSR